MRPLLLALLILLAGCTSTQVEDVGSPSPEPEATPEPSTIQENTTATPSEAAPFQTWMAASPCDSCFEPSVAISGAHLILTAAGSQKIHVLGKGGGSRDLPPIPAGGSWRGDGFVETDAQGRLWYSALVNGNQERLGVQVARSDDLGATWATDVFIATPREPQPLPLGLFGPYPAGKVDRQWLAFTADAVHVLFKTFGEEGAGAWYATSTDDGQTFQQPTRFIDGGALIIGQPRSIDGDAWLPFFDGGDDWSLKIAVLGGDEWQTHDAVRKEGGVGEWFPSISYGADAGFVLAWNDFGGTLHVARSTDGRSWATPQVWAENVRPSPWTVATARSVGLAWFEESEGAATLWWSPDVLSAQTPLPVVSGVQGDQTLPAYTDFAHVVTWTDGDITEPWLTWADPDGIRLVGPTKN